MKLLLVLALAVLAAARPFTDEWEDFKKVHYLALNAIKHHMHSLVAMQMAKNNVLPLLFCVDLWQEL